MVKQMINTIDPVLSFQQIKYLLDMLVFTALLAFDILLLAQWQLDSFSPSCRSQIQSLLLCLTLDGFHGAEEFRKKIPLELQFVAGHFLIIWTGHILNLLNSQEYWTSLIVKTPKIWYQPWKVLFDVRWISTSKPAIPLASSRSLLQ
jgi:hypothetical protein